MEKMTVNAALTLKTSIEARKRELTALRDKNSIKETFFGNENKVIEPRYDPKLIDAKISELTIFLFKLDAEIKRINAVTLIDMTADVDSLLAPIT